MRQAGVAAVGLALGAGGMAFLDREDGPRYRPQTPSVTAFSFTTLAPDAPPRPAEAVPVLAQEPARAVDAVAAFLQAQADGRPDLAYPLLDEPGRRTFPTLAAWRRAQVNRARPVTYEVGGSRPSPDRPGAVEVDVSATHEPSLSPVSGLVPGHSQSVWLVRREGEAWRVAAEPLSFRPVLPADAGATEVVQGWVSRLAACDAPGAAQMQVRATLYGPSSFARVPCERQGTWTAGAPVGLDRAVDARTYVAAFGPEVGRWARMVPVRGPGSSFLAAVAPIGDGWQVMGVAVEGR